MLQARPSAIAPPHSPLHPLPRLPAAKNRRLFDTSSIIGADQRYTCKPSTYPYTAVGQVRRGWARPPACCCIHAALPCPPSRALVLLPCFGRSSAPHGHCSCSHGPLPLLLPAGQCQNTNRPARPDPALPRPAVSALQLEFEIDGSPYICSGALFKKDRVLTAGHCVWDDYSSSFVKGVLFAP